MRDFVFENKTKVYFGKRDTSYHHCADAFGYRF